MSSLTLTKNYLDGQLLYASDVHDMWTELETKTNGSLDDDNVNASWASLSQVTLAKDISFTFGATDSAYLRFITSSSYLKFGNTGVSKDTIFKVESAEAARIDVTTNNFVVKKDLYFSARSTAFSMFRLLGTYRKPVLVYVDSDSIDVENNTETANQSLIVFPSGPVAVTEDTTSTHKFRRLETGATANGYSVSHTGAADSGLRTGLSLSANTWYFVYAVRVQYGDDAGNNFILVLDDTSPVQSNESTLNSRYGANEWVYMGLIRRGYGMYTTTTLVPFQQDKTGWTYFIDRASSGYMYGMVINDTTVTTTTNTAQWTFTTADSGYGVPSIVSAIKVDMISLEDGDGYNAGTWEFGTSTSARLFQLPSFYNDTSASHSYSIVVPAVSGLTLSGRRSASASSDDFYSTIYLSGFLDHYV